MLECVVKVNSDILKRKRGAVGRHLEAAVRLTAFAAERAAKRRAPVDTGALRASIYTVTHSSDGREDAVYNAKTAYMGNTKKGFGYTRSGEFPEAAMPKTVIDSPWKALVAVAAAYGVHLEYGTHRMSARPFLTPAALEVKSQFQRNVQLALLAGSRS